MHTTNYYNTFIEVAEDCPVEHAKTPPLRGGKKSIARMQYDMISEHPYTYTSDDIIFEVYAVRNGIPEEERASTREKFFSKGQPCLRASALGKRYGWGVHSNDEGKIALVPLQSIDYTSFLSDPGLQKVKAMRTGRK